MIGFILIVALIAILFLYDTLSWGLVLYKFWGWFVLPVFVAAPAITFVQALGLMFVVGLFHNQSTQRVKKEYRDPDTDNLYLIMPWVALFFGWLAYNIFVV